MTMSLFISKSRIFFISSFMMHVPPLFMQEKQPRQNFISSSIILMIFSFTSEVFFHSVKKGPRDVHCVAFLRFWASVKDKDIHTVFSIQKSIAQSGGKKSVFSEGAEDKKTARTEMSCCFYESFYICPSIAWTQNETTTTRSEMIKP